MANKKISQLTERTKLTGNEMLPFQEGNYNGKIRSSLLTSLSGSGDDLQKIRSTKGQIVASYGNGIIRNVIHDNNQYCLKFDEPISYVVGDILNCTTYSGNNKKNYSLVIQNIEKNYIIISESQYEQSKPQIGDETVQIGNTDNEKRAGIVSLTAAPNENIGLDCYSDIYTTNSDGQLRVRVGYLNGIYDSFFPEDGQPNGYGLYGNNCFLVGDFLLRDGSNITNLIDNINLSVSSNTNEISSLKNKTTGLEQTTQTITKQISEIKLDIDSITLRVSKNESTITNLEGKTNTVSSDVAQIKLDTEKIESNVTSISSKVNSNTGRIEAIETESAGWVTTAKGNTLWAAKGQTEEDIKTAKNAAEIAAQAAAAATQKANSAQTAADSAQTAADDAADDAADAYSKATNAAYRANSAYSLANSANNKATSNATAIQQTDEYISLISGNFDSNGDIINAAGWVTTSEGNTLWARKELEDGNKIVSYINQTATTVEISAEKINFIGKTVINGKFIVDTSGNVTLNNLTANDGIFNGEVNAISGSIGDFVIRNQGLYNVTSDSTDPGAGIDISNGIGTKSFKANSISSSSMCEIRSDNSVVLQLTSYGKDGVGLFILCNDTGKGYAIQSLGNSSLEARSGETITIHGLCLNYRTIVNTAVLNTNDDFILFTNRSSITVSLLGAHTSPGKIIYFKQAGSASVTIKGTIMQSNSKTTTTKVVYNGIYSWFYISDGSKWIEFSC